jgi:soluble lytic murein transglycosylase
MAPAPSTSATSSAPSALAIARRRLLWALLLMLLGMGLVDWWYQQHKEHRYDSEILRVSQQYRIDPALVKAVVWRESKFNPRVRGRVGEIGLMQIRPGAAQEWAQTVARQRTFSGNLFEPETNLEVGAWYLSKLLKRYGRTNLPAAYALADYNAGRANVLRWIGGAAQTNSAAFVAHITFPGTQEYVRSILRQEERYRGTFRGVPPAVGAR